MEDINNIWNEALELVSKLLPVAPLGIYINTLIPISLEDEVFTLLTENDFNKDIIIGRYLDKIEKALTTVCNEHIVARVVLKSELDSQPSNNDSNTKINNEESKFYDKYVFETFVSGKNSNIAYASARQVAEKPGQVYNPLFLWGGVGLGKTHLMFAIYNYIVNNFPQMKVLYCTSEEFTNEFITSISKGQGHNTPKDAPSKFRAKYREVDVLLIDDIQFLIGKEGTQEELFHTFNALQGANKQVVISSDQPPHKMVLLEERLSSRFSQGLTVDISSPDFETRSAILQKKAEFDNLNVPDDVISYISQNITTNIRELEGALTRVAAYSKLSDEPITLDLSKTALKDIINKPLKQEITIPFIQEIVANYFSITVEDIRGKKRPAKIAYARQIAMYLSCKYTDDTLVRIGKEYFGGRDHSTVHYASKVISKDIAQKDGTREMIQEIENKIKL